MNCTDGTIDYCKYCIKKDIIMIKKAICPNCGAEGTVGRYCEFCGTKIVELKKDTEYSTTIRKTVLDFKI